MSGVAALDAVQEGQRLTVYVHPQASGGVWKAVNGGKTFKPVFDKQPVRQSARSPLPLRTRGRRVGTGDRGRATRSVGDGVYKSVDGGDNWTHVGLKESERHRQNR